MCITTIHLGANHDVNNKYEEMDELLTPLTVLFTNNISDADEKKRIICEEYGFKLTDDLCEEVDTMCNLSEGIAIRNKNEGRKEGIIIGEKRGLKLGEERGRIKIIIDLVKDGDLTIEKAARKLGKTVEDFITLMKEY